MSCENEFHQVSLSHEDMRLQQDSWSLLFHQFKMQCFSDCATEICSVLAAKSKWEAFQAEYLLRKYLHEISEAISKMQSKWFTDHSISWDCKALLYISCDFMNRSLCHELWILTKRSYSWLMNFVKMISNYRFFIVKASKLCWNHNTVIFFYTDYSSRY